MYQEKVDRAKELSKEMEVRLPSQFDAEEHPLELQFQFEDEEEELGEDIYASNNQDGTYAPATEGNGADEELEDDIEGDEEGYRFRFHQGMDPLSFTQEDPFGLQPYQQFERLEHQYEVLAAKKQKFHVKREGCKKIFLEQRLRR